MKHIKDIKKSHVALQFHCASYIRKLLIQQQQ